MERTINKSFTDLMELYKTCDYKSVIIKTRWQDVPLESRSLAETFKNNKFLHSLLLLFDGL